MAADPRVPRSVLAAAFESLVAAIYLDGGMAEAERFILEHVGPEIEAAVSCEFGGNFKSLLQQLAQREYGVTPSYQMLDEKGPDHSKCFEVCVAVDGRRFTSAWGPNKKMAEQKAALLALEELGVLEPKEVDEALETIVTDEPA
jgi:ribonuclease-3